MRQKKSEKNMIPQNRNRFGIQQLLAVWFVILLTGSCTESVPSASIFFYSGDKEPKAEWHPGIWDGMSIRIDSSCTVGNRYPLRLSCPVLNIYGKEVAFPLNGSILRTILLPGTEGNSPVHLALHCKSQNLDTARMILTRMNEQEEILGTDTLYLSGNNDWQWYERPLGGPARILNMEIRATGTELFREQHLWLDRIELKKEGRQIAPAALPVCKSPVTREDLTPLDPDHFENYKRLAAQLNKPVMAVGEWLHGSQSAEKAACEFLKYRVKYHNTKLVLIELPIEMTLSVNRYVSGDEAFILDSVTQEFDYLLYSRPLLDFIVWLKEYNRQSNGKVRLLGTEINFDLLTGNLQIHDFFSTLSSKYPQHKELKLFCKETLFSAANEHTRNARLFKEQRCFSGILAPDEIAILQFYYENAARISGMKRSKYWNRDNQMFKNCRFLFDLYEIPSACTASIYTHIDHANYRMQPEIPNLKPMGQQLKEAYPEEYACIGILPRKGSFLTFDKKNQKYIIDTLEIRENTLEKLLASQTEESCFVPTQKFDRLFEWSRYGSSKQDNSPQSWINPAMRTNGIIVLRESLPVEKPRQLFQSVPDRSRRYIEKYKKKIEETRSQSNQ